jgi:hypothetical protein
LLSLSLYALVAIDRDSARSTEAAMKYFVLGALASGLLLYGMSMIYGATGSLEIGAIAQAALGGRARATSTRAGLRPGVPRRRHRLQARRRAFPHVDSRCVPRGADGSDPVHRLRAGSSPPSPWRCACWSMGLFDLAVHWQRCCW